jgi:competence protein ComEC
MAGDAPSTVRAFLERLRRTIADALDPPGEAARGGPVLRALVTGDRSSLTDPIRGPFRSSGTAHLLVVSGLHVGWAFALGRLLGLALLYPWPSVRIQRGRRVASSSAGLVVAGAYAGLAGLSVPTLRAAVMAAAGTFALLGGRPGTAWSGLAAAALVVGVVEPAALFEASFQLSFLAVAGILVWRPGGGAIRRLLGASLGASIATGCVLAALDLPLPAAAPLANLLLVPWFGGVVLPLGLLAGPGSLLSPDLGAALVPIARGAALAGLRGAEGLASGDLLGVGGGPPFWAALGALMLALRAWRRGAPRLAAFLALLSVVAAVVESSGRGFADRGDDEVLFLDVGQGDATLARLGDDVWLVDAGPGPPGSNAGTRVVLPALRALGVSRLDVLVLTHADRDHVGGARRVLERLEVGEIWIGAPTLDDAAFREVRRLAAARRIPLRLVSAGESTRVHAWNVDVLWPPRGADPRRRNDGSLVLRLRSGEGCVLLPSDAPVRVERQLLGDLGACSVLKLGHHGSATSSGERWLGKLEPEVAVASASASRAQRFPAPEVRQRLRRTHVTLYETARWGAVRLRFADGNPVAVPYRLEPLPSSGVQSGDAPPPLQGRAGSVEYSYGSTHTCTRRSP